MKKKNVQDDTKKTLNQCVITMLENYQNNIGNSTCLMLSTIILKLGQYNYDVLTYSQAITKYSQGDRVKYEQYVLRNCNESKQNL